MATPPVVRFYLVHAETGQRYPVAERDVVIGRSSGDVLFPDDDRLAAAQARLFTTDRGLSVQNLANGAEVLVEDRPVAPNHVAGLDPTAVLVVGRQAFRLVEVRPSARVARPPAARADRRPYVAASLLAAAALGLLLYAGQRRSTAVNVGPDPDQVAREVDRLLNLYREIGAADARGETPDVVIRRLRGDLIPGLERVAVQLTAESPRSATGTQRRSLNLRLVRTLVRQTRLLASFYETGDAAIERELANASRELAGVRAEGQLGTRRAAQPTNELPSSAPPAQ